MLLFGLCYARQVVLPGAAGRLADAERLVKARAVGEL